MKDKIIIDNVKLVLKTEAECIINALSKVDNSFAIAVKTIISCRGRIIVSGIGKAGHIANKVASTFSSLGTPSFFIHSAEAVHGDSGMVTNKDIVLFISNSGETQEILNFVAIVKKIGATIISITGNPKSTLAINSKIHLFAEVKKEADFLNLAPTASSTLALALCDALATVAASIKGFSSKDFSFYHPGGSLGKLLKV